MKAKLLQTIDETVDIRSFRLEPEKKFIFKPGQWMNVKLDEELRHDYSISASPTEDFIQFTTQNNPDSPFKTKLWKMKPGEELQIRAPFGEFVFDEADKRPRIFIAGGIGITPFRSMLKYMYDQRLTNKITLFYSATTVDEFAFAKELDTFRSESFLPVRSITGEEVPDDWKEEKGRINAEMIRKYCPELQNSTLWICGPAGMVEAMMDLGEELDIEPERMKTEEFPGY